MAIFQARCARQNHVAGTSSHARQTWPFIRDNDDFIVTVIVPTNPHDWQSKNQHFLWWDLFFHWKSNRYIIRSKVSDDVQRQHGGIGVTWLGRSELIVSKSRRFFNWKLTRFFGQIVDTNCWHAILQGGTENNFGFIDFLTVGWTSTFDSYPSTLAAGHGQIVTRFFIANSILIVN